METKTVEVWGLNIWTGKDGNDFIMFDELAFGDVKNKVAHHFGYEWKCKSISIVNTLGVWTTPMPALDDLCVYAGKTGRARCFTMEHLIAVGKFDKAGRNPIFAYKLQFILEK